MKAMCATDNRCQGMSDRTCEFVPDTDSFLIGLDNHATCCMKNDVHNFVIKLTPTPNIRVRGVGNQLMMAKGRGTVLWKIEDDNGVVHEKLFSRNPIYSRFEVVFTVTTVVVPVGRRSLSETRRDLRVPDC
jgi:hypothetical protein